MELSDELTGLVLVRTGDGGRTGHTAGMEGTHRELGSRLSNRLRGDDARCDTDFHQLAAGKVGSVALRADSLVKFAGQRRPNAYREVVVVVRFEP